MDDSTNCQSCVDGYYLESIGTCVKCTEGCATCNDDTICNSCNDTHYFEDNSCIKC